MVNGGQMTGESVLCRGLAERRANVTGVGSGIGRACAVLLARHGTAVAVADLREDTIYGIVDEITADGGRAIGGVRATRSSRERSHDASRRHARHPWRK
jgi:NAD(P)-dependent dehydrogenase (short-subunit alcohol dehydrogenase family)